jgi:hypothetical protein
LGTLTSLPHHLLQRLGLRPHLRVLERDLQMRERFGSFPLA